MKNVRRIDWSARKEKRDNDIYLNKELKKLLRYREDINILSLPGEKWLWERQLIQNFPENKFNIVGVESDPHVNESSRNFIKLNHKNKRNQIDLLDQKTSWEDVVTRKFNSSLFDSSTAEFDIIYGDFMGTFNRSIIGHISHMLEDKKMIKPLGNIIFTFLLGRGLRDIRKETLEIGRASKYSDLLYFDDDMLWNRYESKTKSDEVHPYAIGIMETILQLGKKFGKILMPAKPHIYYSPGRDENHLVPEGSFCFTLIK